MTEGLQLLLRHAFVGLQRQALGASIQPGNLASIALVRRAGFRPEKAPPRYLRLAGSWRGPPTLSITPPRVRQPPAGQPPRAPAPPAPRGGAPPPSPPAPSAGPARPL